MENFVLYTINYVAVIGVVVGAFYALF